MATSITPVALATQTTQAVTEVHGNVTSQTYYKDADIVGNAINLDAGSRERVVTLALTWVDVSEGGRDPAIVAGIEGSEDQLTWTPIPTAKFAQVNLGYDQSSANSNMMPAGVQRIGFVSPFQFIRARVQLLARQGHGPGKARFSVDGTKS